MVRKVAIWSGSLLKENEQKKQYMCLCTFCIHGSGAFNKYVAKIHALCLENFCTSKSAIQKFWTFWVTGTHTKPISVCVFCILVRGHQIIILPIWIIMSHHAWGNSVSIYVIFHMKIHLPFLDQHFPHFLVLKKTSTIVAFAFWVTFYQHPFLLKFSPFFHVCFPAYNPYVTTILNDN